MHYSPNSYLHITIITGLAGSGKTTALNAFEEKGFYCVDNLPSFLLTPLIKKTKEGQLANSNLALVMDARDPAFLKSTSALTDLAKEISLEIIFLEAQEEVLIRRFSQHRRSHPISPDDSLRKSIAREKVLMGSIRGKATTIIDTSPLTPYELKRRLHLTFDDCHLENFKINLLSFGFKHGIPHESDLIWDVRFLPNPHYDTKLKPLTGIDKAVAHYVLDNETTQKFFNRLDPLLEYLIPKYVEEGKVQLTISVGCTGGRHRSVAVAERLQTFFSKLNIKATLCHRDIDRGS
jgi:RNase adapter protein RapZ